MPLFESRLTRGHASAFLRGGLCFALFLALSFGCRKPSGTGWDVDVVVPLLNSSLTLSSFVGDTLLGSDTTGLLHLRYNRRVASLKLDSLIQLPAAVYDTSLRPPVFGSYTIEPGQTFDQFDPAELTFKVDGGVEIAYADMRDGYLTIDFSNELSETLDIDYKVPSATKNGQPLTISGSVPPGQHTLVKTYRIDGYRFNMRGINGNKYNTIVQTYTVGLNSSANPLVVYGDKGLLLSATYGSIVPQYIEGYFGQQTFDIKNDTVSFGVSKGISIDNFMLSDASMKFSIINEIGADFVGSFSGINSINTKKNKTVPLVTSQLSRIPINWPVEKLWDGVRGSTTTLVFNASNSNIVPFISNLPDRISYEGKASINPKPQGDVVGHSNYAFYNTGIHIDVDVDIPLKYSADRFRLETTAATDFSNIKQLDNVRGGNFIISVTNGYPFTAYVQVYMQNGNGNVIDSLLLSGSNIVQRGQLDGNNRVLTPATSELIMPATPEKAKKLKDTKSLRIKTTFQMPPNPPDIPIYDNYEFDVKVRAELLYNVGIRAQ